MKADGMTREALQEFVVERKCEDGCEGTCDDCPFDLPKVNAAMDAYHTSDAFPDDSLLPNVDYLLDTLAALTRAMAAISGIMRVCREIANLPQEVEDAEEV